MKVALVAQTAAPSRCFLQVYRLLRDRGHEAILIVGDGKPISISDEEMVKCVVSADLVCTGMSNAPELAIGEVRAATIAQEKGIPYGFYGDIAGCWSRARKGAWFEEVGKDASFYLGMNQKDAEEAIQVFPKAQFFGTGNPLREEAAFPTYTREEVRRKLEVKDDEILVLAPGDKFVPGNVTAWQLIAEALYDINFERNCRLILSFHPGDKYMQLPQEMREQARVYEDLIKYSPVPTWMPPAGFMSTTEMVPGADIVIDFCSSVLFDAAYLGIPAISLSTESRWIRLEANNGHRNLEPVSMGVCQPVEFYKEDLAGMIGHLLTEEGFAHMRKRQQEACPKPERRGAALERIADAFASILS